jgi:hypothetical protein
MRVRLRVSGGIGAFPGLAVPRTIDIDTLPPEDRATVERLVEEAGFFHLPRQLPPPPGSADYESCEITVDDGPRRHTVTVSDPIAHPALQALVARLRQLAFRRP